MSVSGPAEGSVNRLTRVDRPRFAAASPRDLLGCGAAELPIKDRRTKRQRHLDVASGCDNHRVTSRRGLLNSIGTTGGYLRSLLAKHTPLRFDGSQIGDIYNYLQINERLATSGQPTSCQFEWIAAAGYATVINLLPADSENSLAGEPELVAELGMRYVHIPVDFKAPREQDFERFAAAMSEARGERTWVHCAANARVSAFVYRYRTAVEGEEPSVAFRDVEQIWQPYGVWARFIGPGKRTG